VKSSGFNLSRYKDVAHDYRIKKPKTDFGLNGFKLKDFSAIKAALDFAMLTSNLMRLFRQVVMRNRF